MQSGTPGLSNEQIVGSLYRGILEREPDVPGLNHAVAALDTGLPLADLVKSLVGSEEFRNRLALLSPKTVELPDLTKRFPHKYKPWGDDRYIFEASSDEDFNLLEHLILECGYYEHFGVWNPEIDLDKRVTAAMVRGLGARKCLELGCFTGPVLSLLESAGVEVTGIEISHLAFVLAYPNVRSRIRYGDLLSLDFAGKFDVIYAMDLLEHLNPLKLDRYLAAIAARLVPEGYVLINSPLFGKDDMFGEVFPLYLAEWVQAGEQQFWRHLDCDAKGWPAHGHLVWASVAWWEARFNSAGLVRDRTVEAALQSKLASFFADKAPARKSLFVLKRAANIGSSDAVARRLVETLGGVEGLI